MSGPYVRGIDDGTESCRVAVFDLKRKPIDQAAGALTTGHRARLCAASAAPADELHTVVDHEAAKQT